MKLMRSMLAVPILLGTIAVGATEPTAVLPPPPTDIAPATQPASSAAAAPTTQPITTVAAPTTQPAPVVTVAGPARLLLLPFTGVDPSDRRDWIGRGVLTSLQADLSRLPGLQPITLDATKPENAPPSLGYDTESVLKVARAASARYAVYGTYQTNDPELRLVGVILDVQAGQPIGGIKATGSLRDIFGMEDSLGNQAKRRLAQTAVAAQGPVAPPQAPLPPTVNNTGPVRNPFPTVTFDDDAARQTLDRLRYRNDYYPPFFPYDGGFGIGPVWGYGYGGISYMPTAPVTVTPLPPAPVKPAQPVIIRARFGSEASPFRGGVMIDRGGTSSGGMGYGQVVHGSAGVIGVPSYGGRGVTSVTTGRNYVAPTPQTGNYVHPTPQTGNYIHPTPQTGNYIQPTR